MARISHSLSQRPEHDHAGGDADAVLWQSIIDAYHHADEGEEIVELSDIIPAGFPDPGVAGRGRMGWSWHRV